MINFKFFFIYLFTFGFFSACQTSSVQEDYNTNLTISKSTPLASEIQRVAMLNTSQDNVIDKSSCFMIRFPYVVTVNSIQININSPSDFLFVHNAINAYPHDDDNVNVHFPITVVFNDYTQKIIANQNDFESLISSCQFNTNTFGKINCLTINYPIGINVYDSNYQIARSISIVDNVSMFNFITNSSNSIFFAISYPISIKDQNGQNSIISTNSQFEDVIRNAVDTCDLNSNPTFDFVKILTSNTWKVSYYFNSIDKTFDYIGYSIVFNSDYTVVATKLGIVYKGDWTTSIDNGQRRFEIKFNGDPLSKLSENWKVFEFNLNQLHFISKESNNENYYLYLEKK